MCSKSYFQTFLKHCKATIGHFLSAIATGCTHFKRVCNCLQKRYKKQVPNMECMIRIDETCLTLGYATGYANVREISHDCYVSYGDHWRNSKVSFTVHKDTYSEFTPRFVAFCLITSSCFAKLFILCYSCFNIFCLLKCWSEQFLSPICVSRYTVLRDHYCVGFDVIPIILICVVFLSFLWYISVCICLHIIFVV